MELEKDIDNVKFLIRDLKADNYNLSFIYSLETVLKALEELQSNNIPKKVIEDKIKELNKKIEKYREYTELGIETDVEWVDNVADRQVVEVLQDLLKGEKDGN